MALRRGYVVGTHPQDHSVDLVMVDNGARVVGVQVSVPTGSTRTGNTDLPDVPKRKNKWDISELSGQDMIALVDTMDGFPVVVGFLYPQVNQILHDDPKLKLSRHQSDVAWMIDGNGDIQLDHPSGAFVRVGESPDKVDMAGKNSDKNSKIDRNTQRKVNIRIGLAGNMVVVTLTPDGDMKVALKKNYELDADGFIRLATKENFSLEADGDISVSTKGNATVSSDGDALIDAKGAVTLNGSSATIGSTGEATVNAPSVRVNGVVYATQFIPL